MMTKLIISPLGGIILFLRCVLAFSLTVFWFIPTIRLNINEDGWITFWFLVGIILIITFRIKFRGKNDRG